MFRVATEPSPLAHEILSAKPYAFLDDAARGAPRAAVQVRRWLDPETAATLGRSMPTHRGVRSEAWPDPRDPTSSTTLVRLASYGKEIEAGAGVLRRAPRVRSTGGAVRRRASALGRRRADAGDPGAPSGSRFEPRGRAACAARRHGLFTGGSARLDPERTSRVRGTGDGGRARGVGRSLAVRGRRRAPGPRGRGHDRSRSVHAPVPGRGVVRSAAPGPHPPRDARGSGERSSPSPSPTSCASSLSWQHVDPAERLGRTGGIGASFSSSSKASRPPRPHGKEILPARLGERVIPRGSTPCACRAASPGAASPPLSPVAPHAGRCARHRS